MAGAKKQFHVVGGIEGEGHPKFVKDHENEETANSDAKERNERAEQLGIKARYSVKDTKGKV